MRFVQMGLNSLFFMGGAGLGRAAIMYLGLHQVFPLSLWIGSVLAGFGVSRLYMRLQASLLQALREGDEDAS